MIKLFSILDLLLKLSNGLRIKQAKPQPNHSLLQRYWPLLPQTFQQKSQSLSLTKRNHCENLYVSGLLHFRPSWLLLQQRCRPITKPCRTSSIAQINKIQSKNFCDCKRAGNKYSHLAESGSSYLYLELWGATVEKSWPSCWARCQIKQKEINNWFEAIEGF